ncbi:crosslink repair DNA glycosylase YcaQ family protein [Phytomonospora sp. NPDC050363]|uniref:DNA glycosylase AlkZ-like family protein n=1 Tax=Phytomonospora sp. NPDC050363 TaxID=3155642 RepID=UPI0033C68A02
MNREGVLRYRYFAQGLDRPDDTAGAVIGLGVQDTPPGSAEVALAARGAATEGTTATWTVRGAPHLHRRADLPALAAALWPHSSADALARMAGAAPQLSAAGVDGREALAAVTAAMREAAGEPRTKGELSAAVTAAVDDSYSRLCPGCGTVHVYESLFRLGALPAGLVFAEGSGPLTFVRLDDWPGVPSEPAGTDALIGRFLELTGPSSLADVAAFLGTAPARLKEFWPAGLTAVEVEGRQCWFPGDPDKAVADAERPESVRLLPRSDPYLGGDRELLVPDKRYRAELWRNLSRRGALLVDGEITGYWQMKAAGSRRLDLTVTAFGTLDKATRRRVESEAELVAAARGRTEARVSF